LREELDVDHIVLDGTSTPASVSAFYYNICTSLEYVEQVIQKEEQTHWRAYFEVYSEDTLSDSKSIGRK
jgi:hypothetical protein